MISKDREYRSFEFNQTDEMRIEGVPIVFEQPTVLFEMDGIKYYEVIDRNALQGAKIDDVVLNINHTGKACAKTKNGTLELDVRDYDVLMRADLSKNASGRELYESIQNGFYDKMSFAFTYTETSYDKATRTRRILKIDRLYDVSAVDFPAYNQTSLQARSFFEAEAQKEIVETIELEKRKRALQLKLKLRGDNHGN